MEPLSQAELFHPFVFLLSLRSCCRPYFSLLPDEIPGMVEPLAFTHGGAHCHIPGNLVRIWCGAHPVWVRLLRRAGDLPGHFSDTDGSDPLTIDPRAPFRGVESVVDSNGVRRLTPEYLDARRRRTSDLEGSTDAADAGVVPQLVRVRKWLGQEEEREGENVVCFELQRPLCDVTADSYVDVGRSQCWLAALAAAGLLSLLPVDLLTGTGRGNEVEGLTFEEVAKLLLPHVYMQGMASTHTLADLMAIGTASSTLFLTAVFDRCAPILCIPTPRNTRCLRCPTCQPCLSGADWCLKYDV